MPQVPEYNSSCLPFGAGTLLDFEDRVDLVVPVWDSRIHFLQDQKLLVQILVIPQYHKYVY
jgi:hypothetical protein